MIETKGYAVHEAGSDFAPFNFERRDVGPHDILIDILYAGICHSDIHQAKNEWQNTMPTNINIVFILVLPTVYLNIINYYNLVYWL